jgi:hypothetical protein
MRLTQFLTLDSFSVFFRIEVKITAFFCKSKKKPPKHFRGSFNQQTNTIQTTEQVFKYTALIGVFKKLKIMGRGIQTHPIPYTNK